jgi:hypothetical protein
MEREDAPARRRERGASARRPGERYTEAMSPFPHSLRTSPAALRNRQPILEVLRRVLPARGLVLTVAEGTGEHVTFFARHLPALEWQPTDRDAELRASVEAHLAATAEAALTNVRAPLALDTTSSAWPVERADAVFCANMIHIAPWEAAEGLLRGAGRVLAARAEDDQQGAPLVLYGPFRVGGAHTAPSNEEFDASLRSRDPRWGVRDLERVVELAADQGLALDETVAMPANNLVVVLRRVRG